MNATSARCLPGIAASARRIGLALLALSACPATSPALTLREAQSLLFRENPDLRMLSLEAEKAASQADAAGAAWWPTVDALGSYAYTSEVSKLELQQAFPAPAGTVTERPFGDHDRVELGVDATYPLFTGFTRGSAVEAGRANARAREAHTLAAKDLLSLRLAALYYSWQMARAQAGFQAKVAAHARELHAQLVGFVRAGTAVRSKALAAEARALAAEVERIAAESIRDSLALEVADFLGLGDSAAALVDSLTPDTSALPGPPWAEASPAAGNGPGAATRPEERALDESLLQTRLGRKTLNGQRLPQVVGMAGLRYANPGLNINGDEFMPYALAGLQLRWNLFDGSRNREQRRQLHLQALAIEEQRRKLRGGWWKSMQSARLLHARGVAQQAAAGASLAAARAAAADLKRQLDLGLATEVEWLEARTNEARADLAAEQALTLQRLAMLQWRYAAGKDMRF